MARYVVEPRGPFSLEEVRGFLAEFGPAAHAAEPLAGHLHVAVVPDGSDLAGGACVRAGDGTVTIDTFGAADPDASRRQVERMLSLDVDARGFAAVAESDAVVGGLRERHPGWRPVSFASPFEAGTWFLLSQRTRKTQAAAIKLRLRDELGEGVTVDGDERRAFPAPDRIAAVERFAGVPERKWANVRALAHAALESPRPGRYAAGAGQAAAAGETTRRGKSGHRRARWSGHRPGETRGKVPQKHTADGGAPAELRTGKVEMVR